MGTELPYRITRNGEAGTPWLVQQNLEELRDHFDKYVAAAGVQAMLWSHDQFVANVPFTQTTEATAKLILTSTPRTYDSNPVFVDFFSPGLETSAAGASTVFFVLLRDTTVLTGKWTNPNFGGIGVDDQRFPVRLGFRDTPGAGSHTYTVKVYSSAAGGGTVYAGPGGSGQVAPGFVRVTKDLVI